jgi:uncharacterized protein DUF4384
MRRILIAVSCFALYIVLCAAAQSVSRDGQSVDTPARSASGLDFEYQFGVVGDEGAPKYVSQLQALHSGDRFTVRLRSQHAAYAYLFVTDSSGEYLMMPADQAARGVGSAVEARTWTELPDEGAVFRLDDRRGVERVYIVVSRNRLGEIERLDAGRSLGDDWLIDLRNRLAGRSRWTRQQLGTSIHATYSGGAVAFEDSAFRHQ